MKPARVLIADDHELIRRGIRNLLEGSLQFEICGEVANGRDAVTAAEALKPQLVVMDITMPDLNGLEATRQILKVCPDTQVLVLSMHETDQLVREVLSSGARGYLLKADAGNDLLAALDALVRRKPYFTSKVAELVLQGYLHQAEGGEAPVENRQLLSPREREIVQLIAEGMSNKEIAAKLNISIKTAESHRAHIMRKLDLHSVSELVRYAVRNEIVSS